MKALLFMVALTWALFAIDVTEYYPEGNSSIDLESSVEAGAPSTAFSTVRESSIDVDRDEYGNYSSVGYDENGTQVPREVNASKPSEMLQFAKAIRGRANLGVISKIANDNNLSHLLTTDVHDIDIESLRAKLDENHSLITSYEKGMVLAETIASLQTPMNNFLRCFISRKLMPAMECPLVSKTALFGGDVASDLDKNRKECNNYCKDYYGCFSVNQNMPKEIDLGLSGGLAQGWDGMANIPDVTNLGYVEFAYRLDLEAIHQVLPDYELQKENVYFRFDLISRSSDGIEHKLFDGAQVAMRGDEIVYRANVGGVYSHLDLKMYKPKTDNGVLNDAMTEGWPVELVSAKAVFSEDSYYYCDATQVILPGQICKGERVQIVTDSGIIKEICVSSDPEANGPEPTTAAYYTRSSCERKCYRGAECTPTYNIPGTDISIASYSVEIGCIDTPDNVRCTTQKCQEYFTDNEATIFEEYNYVDEEVKVPTIQNQAPTNYMRPSIDLAGELTATGPNSQVFVDSMKDQAYLEMVGSSRYTFTDKLMNDATDIQMHYSFQKLAENQRKLEWLIKPSNIAFDGAPSYKYIVLRLTHTIRPLDAIISVGAGVQVIGNGESSFNDIAYAVMSAPGNFKVYKRELEKEMMTIETQEVNISGETVVREVPIWHVLNSEEVIDKMYDPISDEWQNYALSMDAIAFDSAPFERGVPIKQYTVSNDLYADLEAMNGGYVHYQTLPSGDIQRKYSGAFNDIERSRLRRVEVYGIYSPTPLSYAQLHARVNEGTIFFDNINQLMYDRPIKGDARVNDRIDLFLQGPVEDMNVISIIRPRESEYGKKSFLFTIVQ